jgi:hypothetical protein
MPARTVCMYEYSCINGSESELLVSDVQVHDTVPGKSLGDLDDNFTICSYLIDAQDSFGGEHCQSLNFSGTVPSLYLTHQGSDKMQLQPYVVYLFLEVLHC